MYPRIVIDARIALRPPVMTAEDIVEEGIRLVRLADERAVPLRLLGGIAVRALVPDWRARANRPGRDIDLATNLAGRRGVAELLEGEGYTPDRRFNGANGHKQLYFVDVSRSRPIDVLIDRMEMCHTFVFSDDLGGAGPTLPIADLLLSKLQIVRINRKDILDALILLSEFPLDDQAGNGIETSRVLRHTSSDWGWWRTATGNLSLLAEFLEREATTADLDLGRPLRFDAAAQVTALRRRIDDAPKTFQWRVRAKLGERIRWYQEPEEEAHQ